LVVSSLTRLVASIDRKIAGIRLPALSDPHVPLWIAAGALCAFVNEDSDLAETAKNLRPRLSIISCKVATKNLGNGAGRVF
jgi:hypothetical protein